MKTWLKRLTDNGRTVFMTSHVLETVERVCDRVAIITRPGRLVWEGDIRPLSDGRPVACNGQSFATLEALYLHAAGGHGARALEWIR